MANDDAGAPSGSTEAAVVARPGWRSAWTTLSVAADGVAVASALAAVIGTVTSALSQAAVGLLLCLIALVGATTVLVPWRTRWAHEAVRIAMVIALSMSGTALILHNPPAARVDILDPVPGTIEDHCIIIVRFRGEPGRGREFAVATVQPNAPYYSEGGVSWDPVSREWRAEIQIGFSRRGTGERYEIQIYALDRDLGEYLKTTRRDLDENNTYWVSATLPPGVRGPAGATWVTRASSPDPRCPA